MYPVLLPLRGRRALVAGGGAAAERHVRELLAAGAGVTVVSARLEPPLVALAAAGAVTWIAREYAPRDAAGAFVVLAATGDAAADAALLDDARAHGALVDFVIPAVHRSGPMTLSVDTGSLPADFAARIRDELGFSVDARYARAAVTLDRVQTRVNAVVPAALRDAVMARFAERDIDELATLPPSVVEHEVERLADTIAGVVPQVPATLVCASRPSALALTQTRMIVARLATHGIASTIAEITTRGDAVQDRSLATIGTDSVFVKELELALREGRADYAVHSAKDLPSTLPPDMYLAAVTQREDPRDAFCSERYASLEALPPGAVVGTSSPRRRAQLGALRPDLRYEDIRGNIDTRLRKLREGTYDAIVLACAGLHRLGVRATHTLPFEPAVMVPAVSQGALGIETRAGHPAAARLRELLEHRPTALAVAAERAFLRTLRGGCQAPVGAHAVADGDTLHLVAAIAAADGSRIVRGERRGRAPDAAAADALGVELARVLLADGGADLLGMTGALAGRLFVLASAGSEPSRIAPALREAGADVVEAPAGPSPPNLSGRVPSAVLFPSAASVVALLPYLDGLRAAGHRPLVAALGADSAHTAGARGWPPDIVTPDAEVGAFVQTVTRYVLENEA